MNDNADMMAKKIEYIDTLRGLHQRKRTAALFGCLAGVVMLGFARFRMDSATWMMVLGVGVIAVSWVVFAYVIYSRTRYVRTHPFDPQA